MTPRKLITIAGAMVALGLFAVPAQADIIINPNQNLGGVQADPEAELAGGPGFPCTGCIAIPVTTYGYTSGAYLVADVTGWYTFTYEGAGNAANTNSFSAYGHTFTNNATAIDASFSQFLTVGTPIDFTFKSLFSDGGPSCSLTSGVASTQAGCDYLVALADSQSTPGAFAVSQVNAWIGLSDGASSTDHDYQDLVIKVTENVPEPLTLSLFGAGLAGAAALRRRRKATKTT